MIRVTDLSPGSTAAIESTDVAVVNRTGSRTPIVHVLTWDTEVEDVKHVLAALPDDQPVYLVTPPVADDPYDYPRTVEAWVDHVQSRTSHLDLGVDLAFVGWSFGGVVAAEVAQAHHDRHRDMQHETRVLMIDSQNPAWSQKRTKAVSKAHAVSRLLAETLELPRSARRAYVQTRYADFRADDNDAPSRDEMSPLRRAILVSWFKYKPRTYEVAGTLLWCDDSRLRVDDAALGWTRWWEGPLRVEHLGAEHFGVYAPDSAAKIASHIVALTDVAS